MRTSTTSTRTRFFLLAALVIAVTMSASAQEVIFKEDFESGTLNSNFWTANPVAGNGIVEPVRQVPGATGIPHSGNWALAMGRTEDAGNFATNILDLRLDLSGETDVTLEFWIRSEDDDNHARTLS